MECYGIKEAVESIHLPDESRRRIVQNLEQRKDPTMKRTYRKPLAVAAVLALCLAIPLGVSAAGKQGIFRDIIGWNGAIVGGVYENATDEIAVSAKTENQQILITVTLLQPQAIPYREQETLTLGDYFLADPAGNRITEGTGTEAVTITGNLATFCLPLEADAHTLHIQNFVGGKKGDQPLSIFGDWQVEIP